jgi:DNA repair protein RecO (recombination protein O)
LLLRAVRFGEADAVVTLLTKALGKIPALARGVRRAGKGRPAILEPMHTLRVVVQERAGAELFTASEPSIVRPRLGLISDLDCMTAAGQALRWVRAGSPVRTPEPGVWAEIEGLLDELDHTQNPLPPPTRLAATGLRLLRQFGYELELSSCVRCGKACGEDRPAYVDARQGGLLCRGCGGGHSELHRLIEPAVRARLAAASAGSHSAALLPVDTDLARQLVDEALAAHAGLTGQC